MSNLPEIHKFTEGIISNDRSMWLDARQEIYQKYRVCDWDVLDQAVKDVFDNVIISRSEEKMYNLMFYLHTSCNSCGLLDEFFSKASFADIDFFATVLEKHEMYWDLENTLFMIGSLSNNNRIHVAAILLEMRWKLYRKYMDEKSLKIVAEIKEERTRGILKSNNSRKNYLLGEHKDEKLMFQIKQDMLSSGICF